MKRRVTFLVMACSLVIIMAVAACGGGTERDVVLGAGFEDEEGAAFRPPGLPAGAPTATPAPMTAAIEAEYAADSYTARGNRTVAPILMMAPTPVPMAVQPPPRPPLVKNTSSFEQVDYDTAAAREQRIIIRTVEMALVVEDVQTAVDATSGLALELGGWIVQSSRRQQHLGHVSIRVPADNVDEAVRRLRDLATEVKSEVSTSHDVTDEYVDSQARVRHLKATEEQLIKLMERAGKVAELLEVQRELSRVQGEIEGTQGRIKFLEETSAFSLINIDLELAPGTIPLDAGPDRTASELEPARFRATFTPPEGITEFRYEWNFGDGSSPVVGTRTAPGIDGESRTTATVTHVYEDVRDSPFIVTLEITGTGEAGVSEGSDTLIATLTRVPTIEVFAGRDQTLPEGQAGTFDGSFTRPDGVADLTFRWDFGDGSEPITGSLSGTETTATTTHAYPNHRPMPFTATLTLTGVTETGSVTGSDTLHVDVTEASPWNAGNSAGGAVGALGSVGRGLAHGGIWIGIFSPFWAAALLLAGYMVWRRGKRVAS